MNMHMTLRTRFLDLLPVLLVFAFVSAFATFVMFEYVARQPVIVPPPQSAPTSDVPTQADAPRR